MARPNLDRSVKFKKLVAVLDVGRAHTRGLLELLWDVANENGDPVIGTTPNDVEIAAEWTGEAGKFFAAMKELGWIDEDGGRWVIHDYWDHAPEYVRSRRRMEKKRKETGKQIKQYIVSSEQFGTIRNNSEQFGNVPNSSEHFEKVPNCLEMLDTPAPAPAPINTPLPPASGGDVQSDGKRIRQTKKQIESAERLAFLTRLSQTKGNQ